MFMRFVKVTLIVAWLCATFHSILYLADPVELGPLTVALMSLGSPLLAAAAAALIVHDKWAKRAHRAEDAVAALFWDARQNALLRNIFSRKKRGIDAAERDWSLLRRIILAISALRGEDSPLREEFQRWKELEREFPLG